MEGRKIVFWHFHFLWFISEHKVNIDRIDIGNYLRCVWEQAASDIRNWLKVCIVDVWAGTVDYHGNLRKIDHTEGTSLIECHEHNTDEWQSLQGIFCVSQLQAFHCRGCSALLGMLLLLRGTPSLLGMLLLLRGTPSLLGMLLLLRGTPYPLKMWINWFSWRLTWRIWTTVGFSPNTSTSRRNCTDLNKYILLQISYSYSPMGVFVETLT